MINWFLAKVISVTTIFAAQTFHTAKHLHQIGWHNKALQIYAQSSHKLAHSGTFCFATFQFSKPFGEGPQHPSDCIGARSIKIIQERPSVLVDKLHLSADRVFCDVLQKLHELSFLEHLLWHLKNEILNTSKRLHVGRKRLFTSQHGCVRCISKAGLPIHFVAPLLLHDNHRNCTIDKCVIETLLIRQISCKTEIENTIRHEVRMLHLKVLKLVCCHRFALFVFVPNNLSHSWFPFGASNTKLRKHEDRAFLVWLQLGIGVDFDVLRMGSRNSLARSYPGCDVCHDDQTACLQARECLDTSNLGTKRKGVAPFSCCWNAASNPSSHQTTCRGSPDSLDSYHMHGTHNDAWRGPAKLAPISNQLREDLGWNPKLLASSAVWLPQHCTRRICPATWCVDSHWPSRRARPFLDASPHANHPNGIYWVTRTHRSSTTFQALYPPQKRCCPKDQISTFGIELKACKRRDLLPEDWVVEVHCAVVGWV